MSAKVWRMDGRSEPVAPRAKAWVRDSIVTEDIGATRRIFCLTDTATVWRSYNHARSYGVILADGGVGMGSNVATYSAHGTLDGEAVSERGTSEYATIGHGIAVVDADTVQNVTLSRHEVRSIRCVADEETDTIVSTVYRWHRVGDPLPIAIQCQGVLYVPDANQLEREEEGPRDLDGDIRDVIENPDIRYFGHSVSLTFGRDIDAIVYVMDASGNIYASAKCNGDSVTLPVSGLPAGKYIISVVVSPEVSHKIYMWL